MKKYLLLLCVLLMFQVYVKSQTLSAEIEAIADIVVDKTGNGDYTTIKQALYAVPDNSNETTIIFVKKGIYQEKAILSHTKHNVVLVGEDVDSTMITWDDFGDKMLPGGHTFSTYTFRADPEGFQAYNINFNNPTKAGQGVAFHSNGDKQIVYHCRITGNQDSYFDNFRTRRYIKDTYIEGTVDFIFGFGVTLFDSCQIQNLTGGYTTASSTPQHYDFGHVFKNCNITTANKVAGNYLGRPWFPYSNTVFYECWLSEGIRDKGWAAWDGRENTCIYREYNNFGPGAKPDSRNYGLQLSDEEAANYTTEKILSAANFPSEMGADVDSIEFWSMRDRFTASGYTDRADTILYAGRDTFPAYPTDDWMPVYHEQVKSIIDKYTVPFNDSTNFNANVTELLFQGNTLEFEEGKTDYYIELDPTTVEVPELVVIPESNKAAVVIEYPEELPGETKLMVTSYDRSHFSIFNIYNSINDAYNNAFLDSIYIKNIKLEGFHPDVYEYSFVLPVGSSRFFSTKIYKQVKDASHKVTSASSLPGQVVILVTSYSGAVTHTYTIDVSVSTSVNELSTNNISWINFADYSLLKMNSNDAEQIQIEVFDLNGHQVFTKSYRVAVGDNTIKLNHNFDKGIYLYQIRTNSANTSGKFSIK